MNSKLYELCVLAKRLEIIMSEIQTRHLKKELSKLELCYINDID